jgi:hypothetical protein
MFLIAENSPCTVSGRVGSDPFREKMYKLRYRIGSDPVHSGRGSISFGAVAGNIGFIPVEDVPTPVSDRVGSVPPREIIYQLWYLTG